MCEKKNKYFEQFLKRGPPAAVHCLFCRSDKAQAHQEIGWRFVTEEREADKKSHMYTFLCPPEPASNLVQTAPTNLSAASRDNLTVRIIYRYNKEHTYRCCKKLNVTGYRS
jgi:hypothetical protein